MTHTQHPIRCSETVQDSVPQVHLLNLPCITSRNSKHKSQLAWIWRELDYDYDTIENSQMIAKRKVVAPSVNISHKQNHPNCDDKKKAGS